MEPGLQHRCRILQREYSTSPEFHELGKLGRQCGLETISHLTGWSYFPQAHQGLPPDPLTETLDVLRQILQIFILALNGYIFRTVTEMNPVHDVFAPGKLSDDIYGDPASVLKLL